jgi:hypothetical protein
VDDVNSIYGAWRFEDYDALEVRPVDWEYRIVRYTWAIVSPESEVLIEQRFNKLGKEGWELVSTELVEQVRWRRKYVAIFKRIRMNDNTQSEPDTTQRQQDQDLSELPS